MCAAEQLELTPHSETAIQGMVSDIHLYESCCIIPAQETKPHIQELSIKTTIISRYAFTAVYCAMLNRHSAAAEGEFHFQIPANAYVSNFTM